VVDEGFDVVVRIGALRDSALVARRLAPCRHVVCASPRYLDAAGRPEAPGDLQALVRIGYAYEAERSWSFRAGRETERVSVPIGHRSNNGELTRQLLLRDEGIALMPTFLVSEDLRSGALEALFADRLDADTAIHAVYPHRRHLAAKVRSFVDFLAGHCGPSPYWDEGLGALLGPDAGT
jgi:DNA-binding transcriptional LysR family regulator